MKLLNPGPPSNGLKKQKYLFPGKHDIETIEIGQAGSLFSDGELLGPCGGFPFLFNALLNEGLVQGLQTRRPGDGDLQVGKGQTPKWNDLSLDSINVGGTINEGLDRGKA